MLLFRVVSLVKDQEIDLAHFNERAQESIVQYFSSANYHHVALQMFIPGWLIP